MTVITIKPTSTPEEIHAKTRNKVKRHKDKLISKLNNREKFVITQLCRKLLRDYQDVASKRGTKNFDMNRWLSSNVEKQKPYANSTEK